MDGVNVTVSAAHGDCVLISATVTATDCSYFTLSLFFPPLSMLPRRACPRLMALALLLAAVACVCVCSSVAAESADPLHPTQNESRPVAVARAKMGRIGRGYQPSAHASTDRDADLASVESTSPSFVSLTATAGVRVGDELDDLLRKLGAPPKQAKSTRKRRNGAKRSRKTGAPRSPRQKRVKSIIPPIPPKSTRTAARPQPKKKGANGTPANAGQQNKLAARLNPAGNRNGQRSLPASTRGQPSLKPNQALSTQQRKTALTIPKSGGIQKKRNTAASTRRGVRRTATATVQLELGQSTAESIGLEAHVYPPASQATLDLTRRDVRGGTTDAVAEANGNFRGFEYFQDADGRITHARGDISYVQRGNVGAWADQICDIMFDPNQSQPWNTAGRLRNRLVWQSGHIIGSAMDGADNEPINFFPHHYIPNGSGRWHRMEMIAISIKAKCPADAVHVEPQLVYQPSYWTPTGGKYFIDTTVNCYNILTALAAPNSYEAGFINNAYAVNDAFSVAGTNGWRMLADWTNDATDQLNPVRDAGLY